MRKWYNYFVGSELVKHKNIFLKSMENNFRKL